MKSNAYLPAMALIALVATGCARQEPAAKTDGAVVGKVDPNGDRRFPLTGEIIRVESDRKILVVKHDEIKGFMPAMTMEFAVAAADLAAAKPGQRIRAEMVSVKDGDFRLEQIWPDEKAATDTVMLGARQLREDTHNRGKNAYREIGEKVPDFALYDQDARVVQSARFVGKQIMLNFIFTRCPVATMCPAATVKMTTAQKLAAEAGVSNIEFISITLDPAFDTPPVLKEYARTRGIETKNFSFLTGPENAIKDLLTQFGVIAEFKGDLLTHTLTTLLVDENGKIVHRADGSPWEPQEFVARMRKKS